MVQVGGMVEAAPLENLIVLKVLFVFEFVRLLVEVHLLRAFAEDVVCLIQESASMVNSRKRQA